MMANIRIIETYSLTAHLLSYVKSNVRTTSASNKLRIVDEGEVEDELDIELEDTTSRLLLLPAEVRGLILSHLLESNLPISIPNKRILQPEVAFTLLQHELPFERSKHVQDLRSAEVAAYRALTLTCKLFYDEAPSIFYSRNWFIVADAPAWNSLPEKYFNKIALLKIPKNHRSYIRHLEFVWDLSNANLTHTKIIKPSLAAFLRLCRLHNLTEGLETLVIPLRFKQNQSELTVKLWTRAVEEPKAIPRANLIMPQKISTQRDDSSTGFGDEESFIMTCMMMVEPHIRESEIGIQRSSARFGGAQFLKLFATRTRLTLTTCKLEIEFINPISIGVIPLGS